MPIHDNGVVVRTTAPLRVPVSPPRVQPNVLVPDPQFLLPGTYDISIYRGDTYEWWFVLSDMNDVALDITNWRFKAEIRPAPDAPLLAAMQEVARDSGAGVIAMRLVHQQSRLVTGNCVWDLEAVLPDGWVRTILRGKVTLIRDVTTGFVEYNTEYSNAKAR